jgi:hypothetical protein
VSWIFDDRARGAKWAAGWLTLALLGGWYAKLAMGLEIGWRQCISDPVRWDGQELVFPLWVVTAVDDGDHYKISKVVRDVPIEGPTTALTVGDTVSVIGHFSRQKTVVEQSVIEVHRLRKYKEGIGVAGLVGALIGVPLCFRRRNGRWEERFGA